MDPIYTGPCCTALVPWFHVLTGISPLQALSDDIANNYKKDSKGYAIVDQEYYEKSMETIKVQLQRAGVRLAALINDAVSRQAGGVKAEAYKSIYPGFAPMSFMAVAADAVAQPVAPPALALHQRLTLRSSLKNQKAYRVLAAAILAGVDVIEADSATDEFGQTPVLEVQQLPLGPGYNVTDPNNIAAHVLDAGDVHVASELQASSRDIQARSLYGTATPPAEVCIFTGLTPPLFHRKLARPHVRRREELRSLDIPGDGPCTSRPGCTGEVQSILCEHLHARAGEHVQGRA